MIEDSPSLRQTVAHVIAREIGPARHQVALALSDRGETSGAALEGISYPEEQVPGDWFPAKR